jgi:hypothetical protein
MKFLYVYPERTGPTGSMLDAGPIAEVAAAVEAAGFDGIAFTEHPAPGAAWLSTGGHQTLDPFVALGAASAATSRISLLTYLTVVPYRNPFLLAQLDPSVQSTSWGEDNPYDTWASNNLRIGGSGRFTNDLQVDGSPSGISVKTGYVPSPDMVQEVNVVQNAVDAEYGHSSGSAISVVMKAGTNEFHGNAFYQGQRPYWNALENRVYRTENQSRNNIYGGTLGGPIIKNKLFNFAGYEGWGKTEPAILYNTVPTDLERSGNFSQTFTDAGALRPNPGSPA